MAEVEEWEELRLLVRFLLQEAAMEARDITDIRIHGDPTAAPAAAPAAEAEATAIPVFMPYPGMVESGEVRPTVQAPAVCVPVPGGE